MSIGKMKCSSSPELAWYSPLGGQLTGRCSEGKGTIPLPLARKGNCAGESVRDHDELAVELLSVSSAVAIATGRVEDQEFQRMAHLMS